MRADRARPTQFCDPAQPGPYWAIDAGPVRIVGIDTGIVGSLDADQAAWFKRVSYATDRPKILITGKPLIVNGALDLGGAAQAHRRGRGRSGRQLPGGDRRRHAQLPALSGRPRRAHGPLRRRPAAAARTRTPRTRSRASSWSTRTTSSCYPLRSDSLAKLLAALRREVRRRQGPADALLGRGGDLPQRAAAADADARAAGAALAPRADRRQAAAAGALGPRLPPLRLGVLRLERPAVLQAVPARRRRRRRDDRALLRRHGLPQRERRSRRSKTPSACASEPARERRDARRLAQPGDAADVHVPPGRALRSVSVGPPSSSRLRSGRAGAPRTAARRRRASPR